MVQNNKYNKIKIIQSLFQRLKYTVISENKFLF